MPIDLMRMPVANSRAERAMDKLAERLAVVAIWSLLLAGVGSEMLGTTQLVSLGFYTLHIVDLPVLLVFAAWAAYRFRPRQAGFLVLPVVLISGIILYNFIRGIGADSATALLWARALVSTSAFLMLAISCKLTPSILIAIRRATVVSGTLVAVVAVLRFAFGANLFMLDQSVDIDLINDGGRALSSAGALAVSFAATLLLSDIIRAGVARSTRKIILFLLLVGAEIGSGQGTASAALAIMLAAVFILERGELRGTRVFVGLVLLGLVAAGVLVIGDLALFSSSGGMFDMAHRSDNLETRNAIWAALMVSFGRLDSIDQLIGMPGGQLPQILVFLSGRYVEWKASMHSMYYGSFPVMGYVGLSAYFTLLGTLTAGSLVGMSARYASRGVPAYPFAMCLGTAVLSYAYEIRNAQLIGLFAAIWWFRFARARLPRRQSAVRDPGPAAGVLTADAAGR